MGIFKNRNKEEEYISAFHKGWAAAEDASKERIDLLESRLRKYEKAENCNFEEKLKLHGEIEHTKGTLVVDGIVCRVYLADVSTDKIEVSVVAEEKSIQYMNKFVLVTA
jgi:hypothetical protein